MRTRVIRTLAVSAAAWLVLTGCSTDGGRSVAEDDKLTVCTHLPYEPFEFSRGGMVVGFDVDLMDLVAERLGLEQEVVSTPFRRIQSGRALDSGRCDVAAAALTITADRDRVLDFSDPYFSANQALLVRRGSDITSLSDLSGGSLAVQGGTTGQIYAEDNAPADTEIRVFEDVARLTTAVQTGQVDAAINDDGVLQDHVRSNPGTEVVAEFRTGEEYGFAVAEDQNGALLRVINDVLAKARSNGTYDRIHRKWFPRAPAQ